MQTPITIAIADDHALVRKGLTLLITSQLNLKIVAEADNGKSLIAQIASLNQPPDICITDVRMPVLNGFETLKELKNKWPAIKVLILTSFNSEVSILKFLRNGADGYIMKHNSPGELYNAISQVHAGGMYFPPDLLKTIPAAGASLGLYPSSISTKEYIFLSYCSTELTYKEIAGKMNQSLRTIEGYRDTLLKKLNLKSRIGLAVYAIETGIAYIGKTAQ